MKRTSVELFAGGGGLVQASEEAGFRHLLLNEFARRACETLEENHFTGHPEDVGVDVLAKAVENLPEPDPAMSPEELRKGVPLVRGDVRQLDMSFLRERGVDLLTGGPPCQPFSLGGVAKGDEDERNMFPQMFRAVREMRPKAILCENVRGLLRPSFKPYFQYIQRELTLPFVERGDGIDWREHDRLLTEMVTAGDTDPSERYDVMEFEVNAANYGVPQIRNRVILLAFRADLRVDKERVRRALRQTHSVEALIRSFQDGSYWERHPRVAKHVRDRVAARAGEQLTLGDDEAAGKAPWVTLRDAVCDLPAIDMHKLDKITEQGFRDHVGWPGARIYDGHTPNELDRPAKTVKAGVHGVPGGESVMLLDERARAEDGRWEYVHRYMTVREAARVMTFRDDWRLAGPRGERMRQLGNAVPVELGKTFASVVSDALDEAEKRA
ncbi:DNA (cytosine-5-)-methyltransferase [Streptomyces fagopyri]|uniref:Cytosine-specific methyltransferase n=1 Tax=Streptomyces fagopyri TaxID=2662397 RepID=A0A5Q0LBJ7_9ACTN|nr:DNA cytosine methyltransferase [Streptomyces fagopyri]QFZ74291.1 DNA (cytosine-5-)-methyltransferase [Streptomyces fagopyri]